MRSPEALVGIYGGTFDPVHNTHLDIAMHCGKTLGMQKVCMVLSARPPHREPPIASEEHRWQMLQLAIRDQDGTLLEADNCEILRPGPSWMIDTLESKRATSPNAHLCLILGGDALAGFCKWHRWPDIVAIAHLVVVARGNDKLIIPGELADKVILASEPAALSLKKAGCLYQQSFPTRPDSASDIRARLASGDLPLELCPSAVLDYIARHELYDYHPKAG